jgi:hypothetical protein
VDIQELLDDHLLACVDRQMAFGDVLGTSGYAVDLHEGVVTMGDGLRLRVGLLGTAAPGPRSWMWAWANPTPYPDHVLAAAGQVRAFGEARGVKELVTPEIPLDDSWDATRAGVASVAASDVQLWLPVEAAGGTQVMLAVLDAPPLPAPHPEPTRLGPTLHQAIGLGIIRDWPRALRAYASYRGGDVEQLGERELRLTPAGGDTGATIEVDELGRATSLSLTRAAAAPPPPKRKSALGRLFGR